ncbi:MULTISPECIES: TRAP transporter large permease [unclassified Roseovarius]|uniref:TRAP transporter large permease n=1 Tax=unclassified Roseovarius TaxID=2614913 RepID=UPI00273E94B5|nr:TRAP transporter large permease [Roseovarius sp. MMSF_3350]
MSLFAIFLGIALLGFPIAFAFALAGLLQMTITSGPTLNFDSVVSVAFGGLDSFVLMAIPFFIFAGDLMKQGGIVRHLIDFSSLFSKGGRSSIGSITVLTSSFFGAISGSSAASVAAVGSVMLPEMERRSYGRAYAAALTAASGFIGILIPPSIPLILYGLASSASIGDLFLAGIGPGLLAAALFIILNRWTLSRQISEESDQLGQKKSALRTILYAVPGLVLPILILGGIYSGVFTPTEAAAMAVAYALVVGRFVYRSFTFAEIPKIALGSAVTSATIMIIIGFAAFFGRVMTIEQMPAAISGMMLGITENPVLLMLLINLFLLCLGMFIETATVILLATPILLPIASSIGVDPVHFGVIMVMNLAIGLITPPMALNIFVISRIANIPIRDVIGPIIPFVVTSLILLMLVTFVPAISMFLPMYLG